MRLVKIACISFFLTAAMFSEAAVPGNFLPTRVQEAPERFGVEAVSFSWWKEFIDLTKDSKVGSKGVPEALIMGDSNTNDFVRLPEWEKGKDPEPAAFMKASNVKVYARFKGDSTPERKLLKATIHAKSKSDGYPNVSEQVVKFEDDGFNEGKTPDRPKIRLVAMDRDGKLPNTVQAKKWKLEWKAKDREYSAEPKNVAEEIPLGETENEIYTLDKETKPAEEAQDKRKVRFFYKNLVKWSCENFNKDAKTP